MTDQFFKDLKHIMDSGPFNFIPAGAIAFTAVDHASPDGDFTAIVRGFHKNGEMVIQEVEYITEEENDKT